MLFVFKIIITISFILIRQMFFYAMASCRFPRHLEGIFKTSKKKRNCYEEGLRKMPSRRLERLKMFTEIESVRIKQG